ncbi:MAG: Bax inhibitor-1/YccA family protein [Acidimicrobiia bacterium]
MGSMPNPILNKNTFKADRAYQTDDTAAGWAAPTGMPAAAAAARTRAMTVNGTIVKTLVLLAVLIAAAGYGWSLVDATAQEPTLSGSAPIILIGSMIGAIALGLITAFVPKAAPFTAPLYALFEGVLVGMISALYNAQYSGIVLQAVAATLGVFLVMLFLYTSRTIRVTPRLQQGILMATLGVFVAYLLLFVASLFTNAIEVFSSGPIGIVFSLIVAGVAAFNLLLDFSFIETGSQQGAPRRYEWYCGFGLMVTLVWLYLSILRVLAAARR